MDVARSSHHGAGQPDINLASRDRRRGAGPNAAEGAAKRAMKCSEQDQREPFSKQLHDSMNNAAKSSWSSRKARCKRPPMTEPSLPPWPPSGSIRPK